MLYAIIDVEATGGNHKLDRITEVAIFLHNGKEIVNQFHSLINPELFISGFITKLTGISNQMVANQPTFAQIAPQILQLFTQNTVFVAHNAAFDYAYIKNEFKRIGIDFKRKKLCTINYTRKLMPEVTALGLDNLSALFNIKIENRHRAKDDAYATTLLFEKLLEKDNNQIIINELIDNTQQYKNLPPLITPELIDDLPEDTGIYYFLNQKGETLYIGKSLDIRRKVLQHFNQKKQERKSNHFFKNIATITYEETGSELIALLMEANEIKRLKPPNNKAYRNTKAQFGIFKYKSKTGYIELKIKALYKGARPTLQYDKQQNATETLEQKIIKHHLCRKLCGLDTSANPECLEYRLRKEKATCKGACIQLEPAQNYNRRLEKALAESDYKYQNFLIIGEGRNIHEKSVVCIHNYQCIGYGYFQPELVENIQHIKDNLKATTNLPNADKIVQTHLKKNKMIRLVKY